MDINGLRALVTVTDGRLEVSIDDFASATLSASVKPFLEDGKLVITGIAAPTDDGTSITIVGTGGARPFLNTDVTAVFRLLDAPPAPDDNVGLSVQATAQAGWKLDSLFAALEQAAIADIAFKQPTTVYLASYSGAFATFDTGMYLDGTVDMEAVFNLWSFLLGSDGHVTGVIEIFEGVPNFVLAGNELNEGTLGFLPLSNLGWEIYCDPRYDAYLLEWTVDTYTGFTAEITFETQPDGQAQTHTLSLRAFIYDPQQSILFAVDFDEAVDAAIEELAALVNGFALSVPIDGIEIADRIKFQDFKVSVNPSSPQKIEYITLGVETELDWQLIGEYLTLQQLDISFRVDFPAEGGPDLSGSVSGLIGIGEAGTLQLTAFFGTLALGGGLREEDPPLKIMEAFRDFLDLTDEAASQLHLPDLEVTVFDFYIEPSSKNYRGDLELTGNWALPFVNNVSLEQAAFKLDHPDAETGVLFKSEAIFIVGGLFVGITADYEGGEEGWSFTGSTREGETIALGAFLTDLAQRIGIDGTPPKPIEGLTLSDLNIGLRTKKKDFSFSGKASLPVADKDVVLTTNIDLQHYGQTDYVRTIGGQVAVAGLLFDVIFHQDTAKTFFVASYQDTTGQDINVGTLLEAVTTDTALIALGQNISFNLKDALFAYEREEAGNHFLFGLDMGFGIDLSGLPLVGRFFPKDQALRLMFEPLVASKQFEQEDAAALRALIPDGGTPLPDGVIPEGLTLSITLRIGDQPIDLSFPIGVDQTSGQLTDTAAQGDGASTPATTGSDDGVKWFKIQKSLGPVHFERVGVSYKDARLFFLLDASFSAAGLTLALYGLSASSPLTTFDPEFSLSGLGIDYSNAAVEIGGAFMRKPATAERPYDEYDGAAIIRAAEWSLSAIGSYAYVDDQPSMFIYAVLEAPLGGPAFFFVTGLALGFGYNRALIVPPIDQIKTFPLVAEALSASESADGSSSLSGDASQKITDVITKLGDAVPPSPGEYFLAVGIKFTSFELIDSFALLTVSFGNHFEIDLMGISTAIIPTPEAGKSVPPIAEVQMAFKATFNPEEGVLSVQAQLTSASFLLSRDCHLTGGFAFVTWFNDASGHAGDFVLTLGGYHPHYSVPAYYPTVPRLGFNWRISDQLSIKGDAYFALTPNAVMAGGHLDATWKDGSLEAWFRAGADFLLAWKPYHYEASIYIDVGVKYTYHFFGTHHISVDVGADLSLWGPKFAGTARVHLWIVTFTVHFGESQAKPPALTWPQFKDSFLPKATDVCSLTPKAGLVRTMPAVAATSTPEIWVINPKTFRVSTNSVIPVTHVTFGSAAEIDLGAVRYTGPAEERVLTPFVTGDDGSTFAQTPQAGEASVNIDAIGIGTMGITAAQADVSSTLTVSITQGTDDYDAHFGFVPILKNVPAALWGDDARPNINGKTLIGNTVAGFDIVPKVSHTAGETNPVDRRNLQYAIDGLNDAYRYEQAQTFQKGTGTGRDVIQQTMTASDVAARRRTLVEAFGIPHPENVMQISDTVAASLLKDPVVADAA